MVHSTPSRRRVLTALAGTASLAGGCLGRVLDPATVRLTGVRVHNWVDAASTVELELRRDGSLVLDRQVSLAPLGEPGSVASVPAEWSVDPAQYLLRVTTADGEATLDRSVPRSDYRWDGCAFLDVDVEPLDAGATPDAEPTRTVEAHLQEVTDGDDFSATRCPE
jgi:hypothetical protein